MRYVTRHFNRACLPGMLMMALVATVYAWAAPPGTVNLHGMLVDGSGYPLPGTRAYVVRFFDAESGGTQLGGDLAGMVEVSPEGLFNLPVLLPLEALAAAEVWYELGIDTDMPPDGSAEDDIFPDRVRVHSVPFALKAGTVAQLDADRIGDGTVDNTTFGRLAGVTQPIQAALDAKADTDDLNSHTATTDNPHGVTAAQVGLGNVDNTADADKPVSTAMQTALDAKANADDLNSHAATTDNPHDVTAAQVGLGNVDNTADADKPVSTAMQTALDAKADTVHDHDDLWRLGGNAGTTPGTQFLGTTDDTALEVRVNNERAMRIVPNAISPSLIGGFSDNSVTSGVVGAVIGGGGVSGNENRVTDHYGTIGGGIDNQAGDNAGNTADRPYATVGGGLSNTASGSESTVGGGLSNTASGSYSTVGGGYLNTASDNSATVGGGGNNDVQAIYGTIAGGGPLDPMNPYITNNRVTDNYGAIGGGGGNQAGNDDGSPGTAAYATVGGGYGNTASGEAATVGGGWGNTASKSAATVGGGVENTAAGDLATVAGGYANTATGEGATVGGGVENTASYNSATVGGGAANTASDGVATVGGGVGNTASGYIATVGGGGGNTASGLYSTVGGGVGNTATGQFSTVPGGSDNTAQGNFSFAAGRRARAEHEGAFVWGDSTNENVASSAADEFTVRASGGVRFFTNSAQTMGVQVAGGGSSWASVSDRNVKENFEPVDGVEVLEKVAALPISTWNYQSQDASIRHIGPMAQDVYAAFGVGESDTAITAIDADGIALAAIQGLNQRLEQRLSEKDREIAALREEITAMKAILQEVTAR